MSLKTEAIVLQERPWREADRLYYILTPQEGKLKILLKSAGRSSSKMAGHMSPFSRIRLMIGRGRHDHLAGVDILDSNINIRQNLLSLSLASAVAELVLRINVAGQEARHEYQLVSEALELLADTKLSPADKVVATRIFLWKILACAGWQPDFYRCSICGTVEEGKQMFYRSQRGFVCALHCDSALSLDPRLLIFLQQVLDLNDWRDIIKQGKQYDFGNQWATLSQYYYQDILEQPLRSLELLRFI